MKIDVWMLNFRYGGFGGRRSRFQSQNVKQKWGKMFLKSDLWVWNFRYGGFLGRRSRIQSQNVKKKNGGRVLWKLTYECEILGTAYYIFNSVILRNVIEQGLNVILNFFLSIVDSKTSESYCTLSQWKCCAHWAHCFFRYFNMTFV